MNAALFNGGKVHLLADKVARCGVGKHSQRRQWQTEFCAVTCQRCLKLRLVGPALKLLVTPTLFHSATLLALTR